MKLNRIVEVLERIAPLELAEAWDNVGLLAGDGRREIRRAMLTIDLTAEVLTEAKKAKTDLLIAYHPPIWEPLKKVVAGKGASGLLYEVIRAGMAVYSSHTALDAVKGGVNDRLAEIVGIEEPRPLQEASAKESRMCKLVVFVPPGDAGKVSEAIFAAGAGHVGEAGKYSKCSFRTAGTGTFACGPGSHPTIGRRGRFEQVEEVRLETILPVERIAAAVEAMRGAHSYEEPAYDLYPLLEADEEGVGMGRFGTLKKAQTVSGLVAKIKKQLGVKTVGVVGRRAGLVRTAAVCAGSGGSFVKQVIAKGCDLYLTGELKHHHALELQAAGVTAVCAGHSNSERMFLPALARRLKRELAGVEVKVSRKDRDPMVWG